MGTITKMEETKFAIRWDRTGRTTRMFKLAWADCLILSNANVCNTLNLNVLTELELMHGNFSAGSETYFE